MAQENHADASNQGPENPKPGRGLRWWIGVICITLACLGFVSKFLGPKNAADKPGSEIRPINVLLITSDTTRADALGCFGNKEANTPNIDRLASQGAVFTNCLSCAAVTLPSHASIMTGKYPFLHGARANINYRLAESNTTLAEIFKTSKYHTRAVVASYVLSHEYGIGQGFEDYLDVPIPPPDSPGLAERKGNLVCDDAIKQLRSVADKPFFLWTHFYDPHHPYESDIHPINSREAYADEVSFTDKQIGRLLDELHNLNLDDNTLVVLVGDHGEGLGDHGESTHGTFLYQSTTKVPLIMRYTGRMASGVRVDSLVRTVDIAPTILEIVGGTPLPDMHGTSLIPLLKEQKEELDVAAYAEAMDMLTSKGLSPLRSLTRDTWVYVRAPKPELYDLSADPKQTKNVYSEYPEIVESMHDQMRELVSQVQWRNSDDSVQEMSQDQLDALRALGYTGAAFENPEARKLPELTKFKNELGKPDPKDFVKELAIYEKSVEQLNAGDAEGAIDGFMTVHKAMPNAFAVTVLLTKTLRGLGRADEALEILQKADNSRSAYNPELGETYIDLGRWEDAIALYRKMLAAGDDAMVTQLAKDRHYYQLGKALANVGDTAGALEALKESVDRRPDYAEYLRVYANLLEKTGNLAEASIQYRQCLTLDPKDLGTVNNLTWILATANDEEVRDCKQAILGAEKLVSVVKSPSPAVLDTLAAAYACDGKYDKAIEIAEKGVQLAKDAGLDDLAQEIEARLNLYRQHQPYRQ